MVHVHTSGEDPRLLLLVRVSRFAGGLGRSCSIVVPWASLAGARYCDDNCAGYTQLADVLDLRRVLEGR